MKLNDAWLILAAYGVWFAIFSGIEEIGRGQWLKPLLSLILGYLVYLRFHKS